MSAGGGTAAPALPERSCSSSARFAGGLASARGLHGLVMRFAPGACRFRLATGPGFCGGLFGLGTASAPVLRARPAVCRRRTLKLTLFWGFYAQLDGWLGAANGACHMALRKRAAQGAAAITGLRLMTRTNRRLAIALSILAAGTAFAVPAGAQFAGGRAAFDQRERPELVQFNDFFRPLWGASPIIATGATIRTIHSRSSGSNRTSRSSRRRRKRWTPRRPRACW